MVKAINVYLITDGNGQEAVAFYKDVFQAELLNLVTWADMDPDVAPQHANRLGNAQLDIDGIRLQISDESTQYTYKAGQNMSAAIIVDSIEEAQIIYDKLKVDAQTIFMDLQEMPWSPAYANLTDKFGMMWQINTELA